MKFYILVSILLGVCLGDDSSNQLNVFEQNKNVVMRNVKAVVSNMTEVYDKLKPIISSNTLSRLEMETQIERLAGTFPREIRTLFFIARHYRPEDKTKVFEEETIIEQIFQPFPTFLKKMTKSEKQQFLDNLSNDQLSQESFNLRLMVWANELQVSDEMEVWLKDVQEQKHIIIENVNAVVANISTVYTQLEKVLLTSSLAHEAKIAEINPIAGLFPREMRALFFIARHYQPEDTSSVYGSVNKLASFGYPYFDKNILESKL